MATPKSQRIGIWIIAIVLGIGTLASFVAVALSINNGSSADVQTTEKLPLTGYSARTFEPSSAKELTVEVLSQGTGETLKATDTVNVSYFGWTADGKIFDSSQQNITTDVPIDLSLELVIPGWAEGLTGQKVGSVLRLTIPAVKAYDTQSRDGIPANSPLEFIVEIHKLVTNTEA
jgi:FKBP-type peptidyl-prolyl cis-trans isomerase